MSICQKGLKCSTLFSKKYDSISCCRKCPKNYSMSKPSTAASVGIITLCPLGAKEEVAWVLIDSVLELCLKGSVFVSSKSFFFFTSCSLESFTVWQTQRELSHASYSKWFLSSHSTIKAWLMECCWDDCLSSRFSRRYRGHPKLSERLLECRSNALSRPSCWVTRFSWISTCRCFQIVEVTVLLQNLPNFRKGFLQLFLTSLLSWQWCLFNHRWIRSSSRYTIMMIKAKGIHLK